MGPFRIVTKPGCQRCDKAKMLLRVKRLHFSEDLRNTEADIASFNAAGHKTFPQIWDGEKHIGSLEQLHSYLSRLEEYAF